MANIIMPEATFDAISNSAHPSNHVFQKVSALSNIKIEGYENGQYIIRGVDKYDEFDIMKVTGFCNPAGPFFAEITEYPAWVKNPTATDDVPAYLEGATTTDEDGNTVNVTWVDWTTARHPPVTIDTDNYIPLNAKGGKDQTGTIIAQLVLGGFTVVNRPEILAAQAAVAPDPEA